MIAVSETISSRLALDSSGKIKNFTRLQSKKDGIDLYLDTIRYAIPFSDFGTNILLQIFKSNDEEEINDLVMSLVDDISEIFNVDIEDFDVTIEDDSVKIKLYLFYDEVLEFVKAVY